MLYANVTVETMQLNACTNRMGDIATYWTNKIRAPWTQKAALADNWVDVERISSIHHKIIVTTNQWNYLWISTKFKIMQVADRSRQTHLLHDCIDFLLWVAFCRFGLLARMTSKGNHQASLDLVMATFGLAIAWPWLGCVHHINMGLPFHLWPPTSYYLSYRRKKWFD